MMQKLKWDSDFFGVNILRIYPESKNSITSLEKDLQEFHRSDSKCAYLDINVKEKDLVKYCKVKKLFPLCRKVKLEKVLKHISTPSFSFLSTQIESSQLSGLEKLSRQIATSSRFFLDPYFKPFVYRLYKEWITQSLVVKTNRKNYFLLIEDEVKGLISMKGDDLCSRIELFGVDKEFRGKGFGSTLLEAAQSWAFLHKYHTISVETKLENKVAMSVYEKNGFRVKEISNQYHIWKQER